jgi:hypothetical protein
VQAQTVDILADYASANADINAEATAGGLFGGTTADTNGTWNPAVIAQLAGGGSDTAVTGTAGVDVRALTQNFKVHQNPNASFFGIGSGHPSQNVNPVLSSRVKGDSGVTVTAGPRLLPGAGGPAADVTPLQKPAGYPLLALYVDASSPGGERRIDWDSDVILLSGPSPDLLIDPTGQIVKAVNVSVNGGQKSGRVSGVVSVDPIINNQRGQALFQSDRDNSVVATSLPKGPLFTFRETYPTVSLVSQIVNQKLDKGLILNDIDVIDATPLSAGNQVTLDARNVGGFQFSVNHDFKPTTIKVWNAEGGIRVAGTVNNPIGITRVTTSHGDILSLRTPSTTFDGDIIGRIRTDSFAIQALDGSLGLVSSPPIAVAVIGHPLPLVLEVVDSNDGPRAAADRSRTADASGNVFLDIQGLNRGVPERRFVTHIDRITAGQDVILWLENGLVQTSVTPVPYQVRVYETPAVSSPDRPNPMTVTDHFRPGTPGSTPTVFPTGVFGTTPLTAAVAVVDTSMDYDFGAAADLSTGLIAGGNITLAGPGGNDSASVAVSGYAHLRGSGRLTVRTTGSVTRR